MYLFVYQKTVSVNFVWWMSCISHCCILALSIAMHYNTVHQNIQVWKVELYIIILVSNEYKLHYVQRECFGLQVNFWCRKSCVK